MSKTMSGTPIKGAKSLLQSKPATKAQINFIQLLKSEHQVPETFINAMNDLWKSGQFNTDVADGLIKTLKSFPENAETVNAHISLVGYHHLNGRYFKAYRSDSGYMYAKEIVFDKSGNTSMNHVSQMVFKYLSTETLMPQNYALRLDRKLKKQRLVS